MIGSEHAGVIIGATLFGPGDQAIGPIGQVYVDDETGKPSWMTVRTGLFGTHESFVPLAGARVNADGVLVGFSKDLVKDAPRVDPAGGVLASTEEDALYRHYGLTRGVEPVIELDRPGHPGGPAQVPAEASPRLRKFVPPDDETVVSPHQPPLIDLDSTEQARRP